jgi:choline monooxygenase
MGRWLLKIIIDNGISSFGEVENFRTPEDDLTRLPVTERLGMIFISLDPKVDFQEMIRPIGDCLGWMPFDTLQFSEEGTRDYYVEANWALYCDNYLEGFHIPYVHPALNRAIAGGSYGYELFPYCSLQLGLAEVGEPCHDIPEGWPDHGKRIYAYYYFLFPNLMFNIYPWGLSLNVVEPLSRRRTRLRFRTYYFAGAPANRQVNRIDQTELEDEAVVESVQLGLQSRFYRQGRFSPEEEPAVHHFHRLVAAYMSIDHSYFDAR